MDRGRGAGRLLVDPGRRSTSSPRSTAVARPGMTHAPDADVHLDDARDVGPDPVRVPGDHRGARDAARRSPLRRRVLRPDAGRRPDPVAAPVLVLRPPRGLHHRAAVLRDRDREIIPVFCGKPLFGYRSMVLAVVAIAALSMAVWAHHMFTTGLVSLPFFSLLSFLIAVPDRHQDLQLDRHDVAAAGCGSRRRCCGAIGFIYVFTIGGITGVMLASPPIDFAPRTRTSSWRTCTTCSSAARCSRASPGSTSGSRS